MLGFLLSFLIACEEHGKTHSVTSNTPKDTINYRKLPQMFVVGNFDKDRLEDTIFLHNYSNAQMRDIVKAPDPFQHEWDSVVQWFYDKGPNLFLSFGKAGLDTLFLGQAQGLYCLINIGDNNMDGKDEVALVVDKLDMSRVNTCFVYTICQESWTVVKQFSIHEGAFDFASEAMPRFDQIKGFLELQNGKWMYLDYQQMEFDTPEEVGKMQRLVSEKCR